MKDELADTLIQKDEDISREVSAHRARMEGPFILTVMLLIVVLGTLGILTSDLYLPKTSVGFVLSLGAIALIMVAVFFSLLWVTMKFEKRSLRKLSRTLDREDVRTRLMRITGKTPEEFAQSLSEHSWRLFSRASA